jgi:hypothetical protein
LPSKCFAAGYPTTFDEGEYQWVWKLYSGLNTRHSDPVYGVLFRINSKELPDPDNVEVRASEADIVARRSRS